jgi:hypothetical protein
MNNDDDRGDAAGLAIILAFQGVAWLCIGLAFGRLLWVAP